MPVTLQPMPDERLLEWIERGDREYIADRMRAGESREVAERNVARSRAETFVDGRPMPHHRIFEVVSDDQVVGVLWLAPRIAGSDQWWIYDIEIDESHRRRGYARAAIELGHAEAKANGAAAIGLNVFAFNEGARHLYESLGYEPTSIQMKLDLG